MKNKFLFLNGGILIFIAFVFFTLLVKKDLFRGLDFNLTVKVQDKIPKKLDKYLDIFSYIGHVELISLVLIIALLLKRKISGIIVFSLFIIGHLAELFFKYFLHQPPPPYLFYRSHNPASLTKDYINPGSSYPSGHSFRAIFIFIVLSYLIYNLKKVNISKKNLLVLGIFITSCLIIISKVVLGEHWPTDIVGGILLGASFGLLSIFTL